MIMGKDYMLPNYHNEPSRLQAIMELDILGLDILGLDILGLDTLGCCPVHRV